MKNIVKLLFLLLVLTGGGLACSSELQRMWLVSKEDNSNKTVFYILAATHIGLPIEYDNYYYRVVLPVFKQAEFLHFEGAGGREDEPYPICDTAILDKSDLAKIQVARDKTIKLAIEAYDKLYDSSKSDVPKSQATLRLIEKGEILYVNTLDEFDIIKKFQLDTHVLDSFRKSAPLEEADAKNLLFMGAVASSFLAVNKRAVVLDLDTKYGIRRAYCSMGRKRIDLMERLMHMQRNDAKDLAGQIPKMEKDFESDIQGKSAKISSFQGMEEFSPNILISYVVSIP